MEATARRAELTSSVDLLKRLLSKEPEQMRPGLARAIQALEERMAQAGTAPKPEPVSPNFDEIPTGLQRGHEQLSPEPQFPPKLVSSAPTGPQGQPSSPPPSTLRATSVSTPSATRPPSAPSAPRAAPAKARIPARIVFDDEDLRCPHCKIVVLKRERINLGADRGGAPEFCPKCGGRTGEEPPPLKPKQI